MVSLLSVGIADTNSMDGGHTHERQVDVPHGAGKVSGRAVLQARLQEQHGHAIEHGRGIGPLDVAQAFIKPDAAQALAIGVAGSEEAFAEMMNARTAELGLSDSSWENPHGLDGPTHLASAYDLAMITREAMKYDMFNTLCSTVSYTIERTKDGVTTERVLYNHNQFLDRYDGADGVKTGYTSQSGSCLVGSATVNDLRLIGVVLNADDHYEKMAQLMDYGFGRYQALELGKQGDIVGQVRVISGDIDLVDVVLGDDISIPIELGSDYVPEAVYDYPLALDAPFDVSEPVGTVSYADRLGNVVKTDLYLARGAERYTFGTVLQEVWQRFLAVFL